ncbi:restriction endonuclease subunit S [Streptomyces noursei]|uniref:restriction endonuclease subunit S n=1 Tax=Streptomyces noursei TaxID=1971 RepID=UPI0033C872CA
MSATPRLGEVAKFVRGITFKPADVVPAETPGAVPCMRTKNVQSEIDLSDVWAVDSRFVKRAEQYLEVGDILVSSANSWNLVGKCCWVPESVKGATFGGFIAVLRPDPKVIHPRYLYRWFSSPRTQETVRSFGRQTTNISNLDFARCLGMKLSLPGIAEQQRITQVMDHVDAQRAKRRQALALLEGLTQSVFRETFGSAQDGGAGYPVKSLAEWVDDERPITYGILKPGGHQPDGVPYVRVVDMKSGGIDVSAVRRTTPEVSREYKRSLLRTGDILMSIRGHVGRLALVPDSLDGANITQDSARISVPVESSRYVMEFLRSDSSQNWMARRTKGAAVKGINLGDIKMLEIPAPEIELQRQFSMQADKIDQLVALQKNHLSKLDELFASIEHRAFSGEPWLEVPMPAA